MTSMTMVILLTYCRLIKFTISLVNNRYVKGVLRQLVHKVQSIVPPELRVAVPGSSDVTAPPRFPE